MALPIASQFDEINTLAQRVHEGLLEVKIILEMANDQHHVKGDNLLFLLDPRIDDISDKADTLNCLIRSIRGA